MPSTTTGSSGPRRQTRASTLCSRRRSTRRTRPLTPVSRVRLVPFSLTNSQARVLEWKPSPKRQACRGCMREFTIDSTWRQDSRWAAGLPPSRLRRTSTRSPRAPNNRRGGEGKAFGPHPLSPSPFGRGGTQLDPASLFEDGPNRHGMTVAQAELLLEPRDKLARLHVLSIDPSFDRQRLEVFGGLPRLDLDVVEVRLE